MSTATSSPRREAELAADRDGGPGVIAGDHLHADAGGVAVRDRLDRLGPRRVEDAPQPEELEPLEVVGRDLVGVGVDRPAGGRQHAQPLAAEVVDRRLPAHDVEGLGPGGAALRLRALQQPVGRALDEDRARPVRSLVERRHELVRGVERHDRDARAAGGLHAALHGGDLERALGRLADQHPRSVVEPSTGRDDVRVVAEGGDGEDRREIATGRIGIRAAGSIAPAGS